MASLKFLAPNVQNTVKRFPLSVISALIVFFILAYGPKNVGAFSALTVFFIIGFFSCGIARLAAESRAWSAYKEASVGTLFAAFAYIVVMVYGTGLLFFLFLTLSFLLVMVAPFHRDNYDDLSFWNFQQKICTGVIWSITGALVMAGGVSIAIFSVKYLFGANLTETLKYVWLFAMVVYAPFNALAWVPQTFKVEPAECHAPPGLPFMLNWILTPLAFLYFFILYGYGAKILLEWDLPRGNVVYMVTGFGALGILTYISGWIMRDTGSRLLRYLYRHFFSLLIPPVILLFVAIGVRIDEYGFTQGRYLVLLLAVWMGGMALLHTLRPQTSLRTIFVTLAGLLFLASFGPWGAVSLSETSQLVRLKDVLERNQMLADGVARPAKNPIPYKDQSEVSSILDYFAQNRRGNRLKELIPGLKLDERNKGFNVSRTLEGLNLQYVSKYSRRTEKSTDNASQRPYSTRSYNALFRGGGAVDVRGYDVYIPRFSVNDNERDGATVTNDYAFPKDSVYAGARITKKENGLYFVDAEQKETLLAAPEDLLPLAARAAEGMPRQEPLVIEKTSGGLKGKTVVRSAEFRDFGNGEIVLRRISGELFLSK